MKGPRIRKPDEIRMTRGTGNLMRVAGAHGIYVDQRACPCRGEPTNGHHERHRDTVKTRPVMERAASNEPADTLVCDHR
jgi:hypothetical protein